MKRVINLLPTELRISTGRRQSKIAMIIALSLVAVVILSYAIVLPIKLNQNKIIAGLEADQANYEQAINLQSQVEQRQQLLVNRLSAAGDLIDNRDEINKKVSKLIGTFPSNIDLNNSELSADNPITTVDISSLTFEGFTATITSLKQSDYTQVDYPSISRDNEGKFSVSIKLIQ